MQPGNIKTLKSFYIPSVHYNYLGQHADQLQNFLLQWNLRKIKPFQKEDKQHPFLDQIRNGNETMIQFASDIFKSPNSDFH